MSISEPNFPVQVSVPTEEMIMMVADCLHQDDRDELWALDHSDPFPAIYESILDSDYAGIALARDGSPLCAFGVQTVSYLPKTGCPWMLGTVHIPAHRAAFLKTCRAVVASYAHEYEWLSNYVPLWHHRALRWLEWLGFERMHVMPLGIERNYWVRMMKKGSYRHG